MLSQSCERPKQEVAVKQTQGLHSCCRQRLFSPCQASPEGHQQIMPALHTGVPVSGSGGLQAAYFYIYCAVCRS